MRSDERHGTHGSKKRNVMHQEAVRNSTELPAGRLQDIYKSYTEVNSKAESLSRGSEHHKAGRESGDGEKSAEVISSARKVAVQDGPKKLERCQQRKRRGTGSAAIMERVDDAANAVIADLDMHRKLLNIMQEKKEEFKRRQQSEGQSLLEPIQSFDRKGNPVCAKDQSSVHEFLKKRY